MVSIMFVCGLVLSCLGMVIGFIGGICTDDDERARFFIVCMTCCAFLIGAGLSTLSYNEIGLLEEPDKQQEKVSSE